MEQQKQKLESEKSIYELYADLVSLEPKLVTFFTADKETATDQKQKFLSGEITNPHNYYSKVETYNYSDEIAKINQASLAIILSGKMDSHHEFAYLDTQADFTKRSQILEIARLYNSETNHSEKTRLAKNFMDLGVEVYGQIDEFTYRSLLQDKLDRIYVSSYTGIAANIRDELFGMTNFNDKQEKIERFIPSKETVEWVGDVVKFFYGGMLDRVCEKETYQPIDIQTIFSDIIKDEFGEVADDWVVEIGVSDSVKVIPSEKKIVIPKDRKDLDFAGMKSLVVHELGVHFFRTIMGSETTAPPLSVGWGSSYDAEEGLALAMEQALKGKYNEGGIEPYISAGLVYFDKLDFRKSFEIKWRLSVLNSAKKSGVVSEDMIIGAKDKAYISMARCLRGTDELPFFKDLAYFNGSSAIWKYLEKIKGDEMELTLLFAGKVNPTYSSHRRLVLESATRDTLEVD